MLLKTPLNARHRELGAKMVDFGGWDMPLHYGSQVNEHHAVRRTAGMFDVSHMAVLDLRGNKVRAFLRYLLANNIDRLKTQGRALYSCMLNENGGVIDDLIVYFLAEDHFRMVVNAGTRDKDVQWISQHAADYAVEVTEHNDLSIIAVQGPQARTAVATWIAQTDRSLLDALPRFAALEVNALDGTSLFVARTGYTGEDGYEIVLPNTAVITCWDALLERGVTPAGLGARDTLRLEAGLNLYGQDMDETTTPFEAGLGWTVSLNNEREFMGRAALYAQQAAGNARQMLALVMDSRGVLRHGQKVIAANGEGEILSGTFSPTLGKSIAFARVPGGDPGQVSVDIRGKQMPVRVVDLPFVRAGKA